MAKLARVLGLRDLTLLTIGSVIGSGIFLVPGEVLKQVEGRIAPSMLVWLVGGILSLLGALTYGELSVRNPKAGGLYVHIRDSFGPLPAFLFGWTMFFAISGGTVATLAVAFSNTLGQLVPLPTVGLKLVAIAMIALITAVNIRGTRTSADVQNWTTAIKVAAIIIMSVLLLALGRGFTGAGGSLWPAQVNGELASNFGLAMIGVLWAYEGWQYSTFSAGEIVNPQRNFPRAFLVGTLALIAIYMVANIAYLAALGPAALADSSNAAVASLTLVLNPTAAKLITIAILISIFSAANSNVLTAPRVYYAMAADGLFFKRLAEVHPRFGTPAIAIIAGSIWASVLALNGTFTELLNYVVFSGWIFYGLAAASIFVYRKRKTDEAPAYKVPAYPLTPLLFIIAALALVINTGIANFMKSPVKTAAAIGVMVIGVPAYFLWRSRNETVYQPAEATEET